MTTNAPVPGLLQPFESGSTIIQPSTVGGVQAQRLFDYRDDGSRGTVKTLFFSAVAQEAYPIGSTLQLWIEVAFDFQRGSGVVAFDLLAGCAARIACNAAAANVLYYGSGPQYYVSGGLVQYSTSAQPLQYTSPRFVLAGGAQSAYFPVPNFAKTLLVMVNGSMPCDLEYYADNTGGGVMAMVSLSTTGLITVNIPGGAQFVRVSSRGVGANQVSLVWSLTI